MNLVKIIHIERIVLVIYSSADNSYEYCGIDPITLCIYKPANIFATAYAAEKQGRIFVDRYCSLN